MRVGKWWLIHQLTYADASPLTRIKSYRSNIKGLGCKTGNKLMNDLCKYNIAKLHDGILS